MVDELPQASCADCIAFRVEQRAEEGPSHGRCRLRPEMGSIPGDLPACSVFQIRSERIGSVRIPERKPAGKSPARPRREPARESEPSAARATLRSPRAGDTRGEIQVDRDGLKQVLRELLEEETLYGYPELGGRWEGGTLVLKPADEELKPKEIPIETFFHKIVMLRDRLRVLEAKINASEKLGEQDKVELQTYVSKCYGTLTSFNALFRSKADHFQSK